jgi:hypothetical protein
MNKMIGNADISGFSLRVEQPLAYYKTASSKVLNDPLRQLVASF